METDPAVRELLARARAGDRTALGKLLENYRGYLQGLAEKLLDHRASARIDPSDVVQQTCLSVHKRISEFEGQDPAQFGAWVRQIHERNVRDVVRDGLRAQNGPSRARNDCPTATFTRRGRARRASKSCAAKRRPDSRGRSQSCHPMSKKCCVGGTSKVNR